ncbi:MAG: hypothetical protein JNK77_00175 [Saprospiraceae bacterium]|nr:hypothetical protein [Saprospiraceae bacterium]
MRDEPPAPFCCQRAIFATVRPYDRTTSGGDLKSPPELPVQDRATLRLYDCTTSGGDLQSPPELSLENAVDPALHSVGFYTLRYGASPVCPGQPGQPRSTRAAPSRWV